MGYGFLVERQGNDHYFADSLAQGESDSGGSGFLFDWSGDDHYTVTMGKEMVPENVIHGIFDPATVGIGVLLDLKGSDIFHPIEDPKYAYHRYRDVVIIVDVETK